MAAAPARRVKGTGSYRALPGGRWELRVSLGKDPADSDRYLQRSKVVHGSERTARAALRELVGEEESRRRQATRGTVSFLMDAYLEHLRLAGRSPNTLRGFGTAMELHIKPALGHIPLADLTAGHLSAFYRDKLKAGLAPGTVRKSHAILSAGLTLAQRWGWMGDRPNPAKLATPPEAEGDEPDPPTPEEVRALIDAAEIRNPIMAMLLFTAATTGARRGELCALRQSSIDLEAARMTVSGSVWSVKGAWGVKSTKTGKVRRLALDDLTAAALLLHRQRQQASGVTVADPYVFSPTLEGDRPYLPDSVTRFFVRLRDDLGLRHVKLHHLRHFMTTQLLGAGVDVRTVSGRGGWANANVVLGVYGHFMPEVDRAAANIMGQLLKAPSDADVANVLTD